MSAGSTLAQAGARRVAPNLARHGTALALAGCAVLAVAAQAWYRGREVGAASWLLRTLFRVDGFALPHKQTYFFLVHGSGQPSYVGLNLTLAYSSVLLVTAATVATAAAAAASRIAIPRLLLALVAAGLLLVLAAQLRLAMLVLLVTDWGLESGFGWGHSFFGTLLTLVGLSAAAFTYYRIVRRPADRRAD